MIRYLHLDTESGGRSLHYSLLTAAFVVTDDQFNNIGQLDLKIRPDDGDYLVSGQGISVNKIDLVIHDKIAVPYKIAKPFLFDFLKQMSDNGKVKLTAVGHGIVGDIKHIQAHLISIGSWEQFCTYHYIDTSVVLQFLRACGKMPVDIDGNIETLAKYFSINIEGNLHEAMTDAQTTMKIYRKMVELGKSSDLPKNGGTWQCSSLWK